MNQAWTGPIGPVLLPLQASSACADEVARIPYWAPLRCYYPPGWRVDWGAYALVGYSHDPLQVHSPFTKLHGPARTGQIDPNNNFTVSPDSLQETIVAKDFPACMALANAIPGRNERVRINYLGPCGVIPKHVDPFHAPRWEDRTIVRFHVPITRPQGCIFLAWDVRGNCHEICKTEGSVWYVDTGQPHMVVNASFEARCNLVIDKFLDTELRFFLKEKGVDVGREAHPVN